MGEVKNSFKFSAIVFALFALLFIGAGCNNNNANAPAAPEKSAAASPSPAEAFKPLKLVYTAKNYGPANDATMTMWLESKAQCGGREAYQGIAKFEGNGSSSPAMYEKVTIYADTGEMAASKVANKEEDLAFDDLPSQYNSMDIPLTLSGIFASAGKNFSTSEVWNSSAPVILKDVSEGMSLTNYSVIKEGQDSAGVLPCQKFKVIAKGTNVDGFFNACAVQKIGDIELPFMVSFAFSNNQGPNWELTSYANENSGIAAAPQCLSVVKCDYVAQASDVEKRSCAAINGQIQTIWRENGCVKEYQCLTQEKIVEQSIAGRQAPSCSINPAVKAKLLACRKNNKPNFDPAGQDANGCLTDVVCRP